MTLTAPRFEDLKGSPKHIHIHGHRGARGILPENTMEGFKFVFASGIRVVELDLLMTADQVPVITHNPRLSPDSTRDKDGNWLRVDGPLISECTFSELQQYDIGGLKGGSDYGDRYPDQAFLNNIHIPRFSSLCSLVKSQGFDDIWLNIEVKSHPDHPEYTPPINTFVERIILQIVEAGLENRVILQSFDWRILHECAKQNPHIPRSYLTYAPKPDAPMAVNVYEGSDWMAGLSLDEYSGSLPHLIAADGGKVWSPYFADLTKKDRASAKEENLVVNVWTVNEISDIDRMIDLQVDGIITDYPGRVQRRLAKRGMNWNAFNTNSDASAKTVIA